MPPWGGPSEWAMRSGYRSRCARSSPAHPSRTRSAEASCPKAWGGPRSSGSSATTTDARWPPWLAELDGPQADLGELTSLEHYHLWHAGRADLLERLGRPADAAIAFARAAALTSNEAERRYLHERGTRAAQS